MSNHKFNLSEGLEQGDLKRLVHPEIHIDEFKSKMGDDADIVVVSFKVTSKEPALDIVDFVEKSYDWVLDADASSGEVEDGDYLVFVELKRTPRAAEEIVEMLDDLMNLTEQDINDWTFRYRAKGKDLPVEVETIRQHVPQTPEDYNAKYSEPDEAPETEPEEMGPPEPATPEKTAEDRDIARMQEAAGVPMNKKAPVNSFTESLRIAAGLK